MNRRTWLQGLFAVAAGGALPCAQGAKGMASKLVEELQKNWRLLLSECVKTPSPADKVKLSNDDWKKRL